MSLAVISTKITGIPELIEDGRSGLLIAPGHIGQLSEALQRLLADRSLRRRLGAGGREKVIAEFNEERFAAALHALFAAKLSEQPAALSPDIAKEGV